jgi:hypothetical protein
MNASGVILKLDAPAGDYRPGQLLAGQFYGEGPHLLPVKAVELSVLWYTAGQGDEDFAVHHFQRMVDEPMRRIDLRKPQRFTTELPPSPLSYDGRIVKVCWCVRMRLYPHQGPESVVEMPFRLGSVPSPPADVK